MTRFLATLVVGAALVTAFLAYPTISQLTDEYNARLDAEIARQDAPLERVEVLPVERLHSEQRATEEEVCLAQVLYSETKDNSHQVLIGWSVRNRVELQFRGSTYCEVAFSRGQFSALSYSSDPQHKKVVSIHDRYMKDKLNILEEKEWVEAVRMARVIMDADGLINPVPDAVYFWHVPSLASYPKWARGVVADYVIREEGSKDVKWAFYKKDSVG